MRHSTAGLPAGAFRPICRSLRALTTRSPYHGDLCAGPRFATGRKGQANLSTLTKVSVDITVVLGTTSMPVHQVLRLGRGAIIELDSSEDDAVNILANNLPVAKGTVVVNGSRIAVEVGELLPRPPDMR